jgi:hypothetical protein
MGDARKYPELISMAFWFRKTNMKKLKLYAQCLIEERLLITRGIIFHIAPSNVDTIFIYSLFLSMIMGNRNIIRISSKKSNQIDFIINIFNKVLKDFPRIAKSFIIIKYDHDDKITEHFSNLCDMRVIWGGDETIKKIRTISMNPAAKELVFADKFSYSVINLSEIEKEEDFKKLVLNYYKDAFTFNQMACSSSRAIFWVGSKELLRDKIEKFWELLNDVVLLKNQILEDSIKMDKINNIYLISMLNDNIKIIGSFNNIINRIEISNPELYREYNSGGGLFFEYFIDSLEDLTKFITKKDQTIGIFGFPKQKVVDFIIKNKLIGINRIVSIGKALDFYPIWDSYNLLYEFSKEIVIEL